MISKLVLAVIVAIVVGLGLSALLGPILVTLKVPIAITIGNFFVTYGWMIGVLAGLWYFFDGYSTISGWTHRTPKA